MIQVFVFSHNIWFSGFGVRVRSYFQDATPVVSGADFVESEQSHREVPEVAVPMYPQALVIRSTL